MRTDLDRPTWFATILGRRVWATVSTAQLAGSTHIKKLRYIESLYQHADQLLGNAALDGALGNLNDDALTQSVDPEHTESISG